MYILRGMIPFLIYGHIYIYTASYYWQRQLQYVAGMESR